MISSRFPADPNVSNCVRFDGVSYCIGEFEGRVQITLFEHRYDSDRPIASFQDDADAERFRAWLIALVAAYPRERANGG